MDEGWPRRGAETEYRRRRERPIMRHPDRIALWAVGIAVVGMIAAAASAHGASGGGTGTTDSCTDASFGSHGDHYLTAKVIDCGPYTKGVRWDLTMRAATELHFTH